MPPSLRIDLANPPDHIQPVAASPESERALVVDTPVACRIRTRSRPQKGATPQPFTPRLASLLEHVSIEAITAYDKKLRAHNERQLSKLEELIRKVGFQVPILVDENGVIIAGHGRYEAAKRIGLTHVPVIRVTHLTDKQIRAFRIADNRIAELSSWDDKALALELKELVATLDEPEVIELTAFEVSEIDARLTILEEANASDPLDTVEEPTTGDAVSRIGDLWLLGKHRLLCGSSLQSGSYRELLQGEKVRAVFSDPPYNVPVHGHVSGLGTVRHREFGMAAGEMTVAEFIAFLVLYLELTKAHSLEGSLHYVCMDALHGYEVLSAARQVGLTLKTTCTWAKTNAGMGSLYRSQTEFVHVFKNGDDSVPHINNVQLGKHGRYRTTLWTYAGANTFRRGRMEDLKSHPTVKPWALVADAIKDCTNPGDAVLDAFCGSGTTIIAAENVHRIGYGIELDPLYVDVAIRRWEKLTRREAVHAATGLTFRETAELRQAQRAETAASNPNTSTEYTHKAGE